MKPLIKLLLPAGVLLPIMLLAFSPNLEQIALSIQLGNSKELARYLDNNVEITILRNEDVYSKSQAEMVLRDFFAKNQPTSFSIIHKGSSGQGSQYGIGTLVTRNGNYRTYIYIKEKGSEQLIQEIRFEKD